MTRPAYEVRVGGPSAAPVRARLAADDNQTAPQLVDAEVLSLIRRDERRGAIDRTTAALAVEGLFAWPGERYGHRLLLDRAWSSGTPGRAWDGLYVALAEALEATLITLDGRRARADGPRCPIEVLRSRSEAP